MPTALDEACNRISRNTKMNRSNLVVYSLSLVTLAIASSIAIAQPTNKQIKQEQRKLTELQSLTQNIKRDIESKHAKQREAQDQLAAIEQQINESAKSLTKLAEEKADNGRVLAETETQISATEANLAKERSLAAQLLREVHRAQLNTTQSELKLLLNDGQDSAQVERQISNFQQLAFARREIVIQTELSLTQLSTLRSEKAALVQAIGESETAMTEQTRALDAQRVQRSELYAKLGAQLKSEQASLDKAQRDESKITQLISALKTQQMKVAQEKAAKEAAQRRQQQALAEEKRQRDRQATRNAKQERAQQAARQKLELAQRSRGDGIAKVSTHSQSRHAHAIEARIPAASKLALPPSQPIAAPVVSQTATTNSVAFAELKGRLNSPAQGRVIANFGTARAGSQPWRGLLYRTAPGAPIKAAAAGQVVFADWLRGFGNMVIIDHGSDYYTLYGFTESILTEVGDTVTAGEQIATSGVTPVTEGKSDTGLYFEVRQGTNAVNPIAWLARS
jgi:murein hydrolase activator